MHSRKIHSSSCINRNHRNNAEKSRVIETSNGFAVLARNPDVQTPELPLASRLSLGNNKGHVIGKKSKYIKHASTSPALTLNTVPSPTPTKPAKRVACRKTRHISEDSDSKYFNLLYGNIPLRLTFNKLKSNNDSAIKTPEQFSRNPLKVSEESPESYFRHNR